MATYLMTGKYTPEGLAKMSPQRTKQVIDLVEQSGGKVEAMYATLGPNDLLLIIDFPGTDEAMQASVAIMRLTGIGFVTCPAVTVAGFDKLIS